MGITIQMIYVATNFKHHYNQSALRLTKNKPWQVAATLAICSVSYLHYDQMCQQRAGILKNLNFTMKLPLKVKPTHIQLLKCKIQSITTYLL